MDAAVRAQVEAGIRCHQKWMELFQAGTHQLNVHYEASLLELKLPPYIQETMLAVAHASTVRQDAEIAGQYAKPRQLDKAGMDLLKFTDEHADHITLQDHQRIFSD
jgi:3-deoxy-D-arabino-heptulosonate 7-phosphate (DAHP) synthase class II